MKKIILLVAATLMVTASLSAKPVEGAYIGLGFGSSTFNDGGYEDDGSSYLARIGSTTHSATNYNSSGYKLYAGYQFNDIIAVEASYTDYGQYSIDFTDGSDMAINPKSLSLSANIGYNFGEKKEFRPFAIIGLSSLNIDETSNSDSNYYEDSSTTAIKFGLGFEYSPHSLNGFGFRIAYESDFFVYDSTNTESEFKDIYTQSANLVYLGAQYKF